MNYKIVENQLRLEDYQFLRATTNWKKLDDEMVRKALRNDLYSVTLFQNNEPVGMGRIIGDGALYFYIQDIIVVPKFKNQGIGSIIMNHIEAYLMNNAKSKAFIGLMAAQNVDEFYLKFGYQKRSDNAPGMFKYMK